MNNIWLAHHGILGQKWGIRRFQNKDGSLTAAGKKHVAENDSNEKANTQGATSKDSKSEKKEEFWTEDRKKIAKNIAVGSVFIAGTALAAYGAYKLNDKAIKGMQDAYKSAAWTTHGASQLLKATAGQYMNDSESKGLTKDAMNEIRWSLKRQANHKQAVSDAFFEKSKSKDFNSSQKIAYLKKLAQETIKPTPSKSTGMTGNARNTAINYMAQEILRRNSEDEKKKRH